MQASKTALILTCLLALLLAACNKTCQTGYENPNCSVEVRAQFENLNYTATESRNGDSAYTYTATIIADPKNIRNVLLSHVANGVFVNNVTASTSADTLIIPYQSPDTNRFYIQGLGLLNGNVLSISFAVSYPDSVPVLHTQTDFYQSIWTHP
jgi:hypothetical protein